MKAIDRIKKIVHDYDGIDLGAIENAIRYGLATPKSLSLDILNKYESGAR